MRAALNPTTQYWNPPIPCALTISVVICRRHDQRTDAVSVTPAADDIFIPRTHTHKSCWIAYVMISLLRDAFGVFRKLLEVCSRGGFQRMLLGLQLRFWSYFWPVLRRKFSKDANAARLTLVKDDLTRYINRDFKNNNNDQKFVAIKQLSATYLLLLRSSKFEYMRCYEIVIRYVALLSISLVYTKYKIMATNIQVNEAILRFATCGNLLPDSRWRIS